MSESGGDPHAAGAVGDHAADSRDGDVTEHPPAAEVWRGPAQVTGPTVTDVRGIPT